MIYLKNGISQFKENKILQNTHVAIFDFTHSYLTEIFFLNGSLLNKKQLFLI